MFDYSLLPDDTVRAIIVALVLFSFSFVFFIIVAVYTLIKYTVYSNKHKGKLKLVCDVAYFHERGKRDTQEDSLYISPMDKIDETGFVAACSDGMGGLLNGEVVSKYVTDSLSENYPYRFDAQAENAKIITNISDKIYEEYRQLDEPAKAYFADGSNIITFLAKNLKFPAEAKEREIQGTVRSSFVVETDGSVSNIIIVNSVGGGCDNEAIRLIQETHWIPAEKDGKYVRSRNMQDITFNIGNRNFQDGNSY